MDTGYILLNNFCHENLIKMDLRVFLSSYDDGYSNVSQIASQNNFKTTVPLKQA